MSCVVFHPLAPARPAVNADWLLRAAMSWVIFFSTEVQISLVQFKAPVGHLYKTLVSAIMIVI